MGYARVLLLGILLMGIHRCKADESPMDQEKYRSPDILRMVLRNDRDLCGDQVIAPSLPIDPVSKQPQIVGGREARPGSWPWMVSLKYDAFGIHWCGGVLFAYKWVLTAAHCFNKPLNDTSQWEVRLGKHNSFRNETGEQRYRIRRAFIHPDFDKETYDNDLALLELDGFFASYTEKVLPLCLPGKRKLPSKGTHCVITGWGDTKGTGNDFVLKEAVVPVIDKRVCGSLLVYGPRVNENMFCAGYITGGSDSCNGDSGGPITCLTGGRNPRWYLAGITSWGDECGKPLKPGVYTRVANYRSWIEEMVKLYAFL